ncbi:hypothetical protein HHK36_028660 [Tetracentron sinense]|uniref:WAT1-related protein n=1 Tax=Tetracentron sinense TaxID=13715 RepID=A0A834YDS1_TETSI|nr:hypothetical protein HHK36_028660 [Tetracentron sinense]
MVEPPTCKILMEVGVVAGLTSIQVVYAAYAVFMSYLMSIGLSPLFLVIYGSFATFLFLFPLSIYFERHKWPKKFSIKLLVQLVLVAFCGVTLFQGLMLTGVKKTSPAIASAMPNLAPGLIFIIAWCLRLEKVKLSCLYSKVKIAGTLVCIIGAVTMSFWYSPASSRAPLTTPSISMTTPSPEITFDKEKLIGCLYLMAAVFVLSCTIILQATTLADFPAPISFGAITSIIGSIITAIVQLVQEHRLDTGWPFVSFRSLVGYAILGGIVNGAIVTFQAWAIRKKGPVLVSMFSPMGTVCSVIFSAITLGDSITTGSLVGMLLMFAGLYFVLWAKGKEDYASEHDDGQDSMDDPEKPLLS